MDRVSLAPQSLSRRTTIAGNSAKGERFARYQEFVIAVTAWDVFLLLSSLQQCWAQIPKFPIERPVADRYR